MAACVSRAVRRVVVVMGPSGCGKSTIGSRAAALAGAAFVEADDHHDADARARMARGEALTDEDRMPWLGRVAAAANAAAPPVVIACSALNERVRTVLSAQLAGTARFALLDVPAGVLARRLAARTDHFAGPSLLASQLAALRASGAERLNGTLPPETLAARVAAMLAEG